MFGLTKSEVKNLFSILTSETNDIEISKTIEKKNNITAYKI